MSYPLRDQCDECGREVVRAVALRSPAVLTLDHPEIIPAPCPRCQGKIGGCYLCHVVEGVPVREVVALLDPYGLVRFARIAERGGGDAVHRPHSCSVRAAA